MLNCSLLVAYGLCASAKDRPGQRVLFRSKEGRGPWSRLGAPAATASHRAPSLPKVSVKYAKTSRSVPKIRSNTPEFQSEFRTVDDDEPLALRVRRDHLPVLILADPRGERSLLLRASVGERLAGTQRRRCEHTIASARLRAHGHNAEPRWCRKIRQIQYAKLSQNMHMVNFP